MSLQAEHGTVEEHEPVKPHLMSASTKIDEPMSSENEGRPAEQIPLTAIAVRHQEFGIANVGITGA